ncbi:hypothetical protein [Pontibacterium sp.]|uniref:hypothetical protein n=1 Tax=Pontibacterium sp. TaxID=2036026 RepID=UPI003561C2AD
MDADVQADLAGAVADKAAAQAALVKKRADQNRRKKRSRDKLKAAQQVEHRFLCSEAEAARIVELRTVRGGIDGPYELTEYLLTLVRRDWEAWQAQQAALLEAGPCARCAKRCRAAVRGCIKGCPTVTTPRALLLS